MDCPFIPTSSSPHFAPVFQTMVCTTTPLLPYQTTHSLSELCETFFEKSGWTGEYTTDIEGLRSGLEEVYTLALADISWEELEQLCSDTNVDSVTPSPLTALYPDAVVPRIRIPSGASSSEVVQRAQAIHRLVAHAMERPLVPRSGDRVFEEATNAQLRASLRLCGTFPQFEFYSKRDVLVALYIKAPIVLSNVTQCEYLGNQASWQNAEIGESTVLSDGGPYRFYQPVNRLCSLHHLATATGDPDPWNHGIRVERRQRLRRDRIHIGIGAKLLQLFPAEVCQSQGVDILKP